MTTNATKNAIIASRNMTETKIYSIFKHAVKIRKYSIAYYIIEAGCPIAVTVISIAAAYLWAGILY